jgi:hypothetical protein
MTITSIIAQAKKQVQVSVQQASLGNVSRSVQGLTDIPAQALRNFGATGGVALGDAFAGINARGDAVQNWCWYCLLPSMENDSALSFGGISPAISLPWYYVPSANMPRRKIATESTQANAHMRHYPQSYSVDNLSLGLFMDTTGKAQQYLEAWASKVLDNRDPANTENQGRWGLPADYKKDIYIVLLDTVHRQMMNVKYNREYKHNTTGMVVISKHENETFI